MKLGASKTANYFLVLTANSSNTWTASIMNNAGTAETPAAKPTAQAAAYDETDTWLNKLATDVPTAFAAADVTVDLGAATLKADAAGNLTVQLSTDITVAVGTTDNKVFIKYLGQVITIVADKA